MCLSLINSLLIFLYTTFQIAQLKFYQGDIFDLGKAEDFIIRIAQLPSFPLLLEGLAFKVMFTKSSHNILSSFKLLIDVSHDILGSSGLKAFLHIILQAGNFLNSVRFIFIFAVNYSFILSFVNNLLTSSTTQIQI